MSAEGSSDAAGSFPVQAAADHIRSRIADDPELLLILGSGLGGLAEEVEGGVEIPYGDVPGFPEPTVEGHAGRYVAGRIGGRAVLAQSGRFHAYEGHPMDTVAAPVRVAHRLGIDTLIVTNAAGGVTSELSPGSIMLIEDHLNLQFLSPLAGPVQEGEGRFPDMSAPYDPQLQELALDTALELGIRLERGIYAAMLGPAYETLAEVRMVETMGGHAVGMSTVPEVITARALGMRVLAFSLITNKAAGKSLEPLSHDEVVEVGQEAGARMRRLVRELIRRLK